jgi:hypothetical protein
VIVGTPGGGDNFVRSAYPLPDGDELILPTGLWERPHAIKENKRAIRFLAFSGDPAVGKNWNVTGAQAANRLDGIVPDAIFTQDEKPASLEAVQFFNATTQAQPSQTYSGGAAASNRTAKPNDAEPDLCQQAAVRELMRQIDLAAKKS